MVGMLVDAVQAVMKIEPENLLPPPRLGDKYKSAFITHMTRVKDKFFIVLDMDAVFSTEDSISFKEIAEVRDQAIKEQDGKEEKETTKTTN
jgi:purine-binding chemotaxis protein CheW